MLKLLVRLIFKYWKIVTPVALISLGLLVAGLFFLNQPASTEDLPHLNMRYKDIIPGQTTHQQLIDSYGIFDTQYIQDKYSVYTYPSSESRYAPDRFYLLNDVVVMKELNYNPLQVTITDQIAREQFGQPTQTYFDATNLSLGLLNKVDYYQDQGMAVSYRTDNHKVVQIQQFSPISTEAYLDTWGKGLQTTQPTPIEFHKHTE